jgi:hypothetical protein
LARADYPLRLPTRLPLLWRMAVLSLTLGAVTGRAWDWTQGRPFDTVPTWLVMAVAVPMVLIMYFWMAGRAGAKGLRLVDAWGLAREIAWDDIEDVSLRRWPMMLFAPSLAIRSRRGRVFWLPRDSQGLGDLHALALREAGAAHPLVKALETPLHRV